MPNITVTLSSSQWTAYQAAITPTPTLSEVAILLREHLNNVYITSLEATDTTALDTESSTKHTARLTKITAFRD